MSLSPAVNRSVSVIIPLYNCELFIKEAIESVLNQSYPVSEIVVVDDGSTDQSVKVVETFQEVTLVKKNHTGIYDTLNCGLKKVKGDFISFLDADDRWLSNKIEKQLALLIQKDEVGMVFGNSERFLCYNIDGIFYEYTLDFISGRALQGGLFRKEVFEVNGNFSTQNKIHGILDWFARAKNANIEFIQSSEVVFQRRIHGGNEGIVNKNRQRLGYLTALKASLDNSRSRNDKSKL